MTPLAFITDMADDHYNMPAGRLQEALHVPIKILTSPETELEILSYYYCHISKCMVLDVQEKTI